MDIIDLTHIICKDMPAYPGTEGPKLDGAPVRAIAIID